MHLERSRVTVTDTTGGGSTNYSAVGNGVVYMVRYTASTSNELSSTATVTITGETGGQAVCTVTTTGSVDKYPRAVANALTGAALYYTTAGGAAQQQSVIPPLANERAKVILGATTAANLTGTIDIFIDGTWR